MSTTKKDIAEIERLLKALIKSLENKHLTGLLPENTDFLRKGRGELYKIESILTGKPALKDGTLQSLTPGILEPSSPTKLEKNHK